jgi:hypothetical protein
VTDTWPMSSQLPEWMRNPSPPERTTLSWEVGQSLRRSRLWRLGAAMGERWSNRYRITRRFPKTTAIIAWFLSLAAVVAVYYWMLLLLARVD